MRCLHLAPARPMLSILLRSDLRDHLLVHLETRPFAYFLIFIRVDSAPSAGLLASLALQLLRKKKRINIFHCLLVWFGAISEINCIKMFQALRGTIQMQWIITMMTARNGWCLHLGAWPLWAGFLLSVCKRPWLLDHWLIDYAQKDKIGSRKWLISCTFIRFSC